MKTLLRTLRQALRYPLDQADNETLLTHNRFERYLNALTHEINRSKTDIRQFTFQSFATYDAILRLDKLAKVRFIHYLLRHTAEFSMSEIPRRDSSFIVSREVIRLRLVNDLMRLSLPFAEADLLLIWQILYAYKPKYGTMASWDIEAFIAQVRNFVAREGALGNALTAVLWQFKLHLIRTDEFSEMQCLDLTKQADELLFPKSIEIL